MVNLPTPHIEAKKEQIAKTVIMPGDPLRAKFIAENFLENVECFNKVRNMLGFTGTYKGEKISVMGSGMGMPSIGIYSYELFNFYDVDNIIRIGTAGAISERLKVQDIVLAMGASTDSNYVSHYDVLGNYSLTASYGLLKSAEEKASNMGLNVYVGNVLSSDVFYTPSNKYTNNWKGLGILAVEMEAAALYLNAAKASKNALCMLTISDLLFSDEGKMSSGQREKSLSRMIELALETVI